MFAQLCADQAGHLHQVPAAARNRGFRRAIRATRSARRRSGGRSSGNRDKAPRTIDRRSRLAGWPGIVVDARHADVDTPGRLPLV